MRYTYLLAALLWLTACRNGGATDTASADALPEWKETLNLPGDSVSYGVWRANTVRDSGAYGSIVVQGMVEPERSGAKVIPIKAGPKKKAKPGILVLNLSKRPVKKMTAPVAVSYREKLQKPQQYTGIQILYNDREIAALNITDSK